MAFNGLILEGPEAGKYRTHPRALYRQPIGEDVEPDETSAEVMVMRYIEFQFVFAGGLVSHRFWVKHVSDNEAALRERALTLLILGFKP